MAKRPGSSAWRRFLDGPEQSLVASAIDVDFKDATIVSSILKRHEKWQSKSYDAYEACSLISYGTDSLSDLVSGITIFGASQPSARDAEPSRTTNQLVIDTVDRLGSVVDISILLYDYAKQLLLVGACNLICIQPGVGRDNEKELWGIYGIDEIESADIITPAGDRISSIKILDYNGSGKPLVLDPTKGDTWKYIWRPSPRRKSLPHSPMRAILSDVEELLWWNAAAAAVSKSRLAQAGALGVPSNLELPAESDEEAKLSGAQRFVKRFFNNAIKAIQNPGAASAAVPLIYTYPWNESGKSGLDSLEFDRKQDDLLEARTDRAQKNIAQGFPLPIEAFFGLSEATHWGAGQIEKQKFRESVAPFVSFLMNGLTVSFLRPILRASGVADADSYMMWYDASRVIAQPDMAQRADKGVEYGAISLQAWRRLSQVPESDAPTPEERAELLEWLRGLRGRERQQPEETPPNDDINEPPNEPAPGKRAPKPQPGAPVKGKGQPIAASANGNGHSSLGHRLADLDSDLLSRVQVMADSSMRRAQERAGNKLKSLANKNPKWKAAIKNTAPEDVASTLGREIVITLGLDDLFSDAFDQVPSLFSNWCDVTLAAAFSLANVTATGDATLALNYSPDEAAQSLVRDLKELAATLLFDRAASLGPAPESDDLLVPASIIRRAIARAGGMPHDGKPNLLLATGHAVSKTLAANGLFAEEWEWNYGVRPRNPYQAHQVLDGGRFQVDTFPHSPGDVSSCVCTAVPIFK